MQQIEGCSWLRTHLLITIQDLDQSAALQLWSTRVVSQWRSFPATAPPSTYPAPTQRPSRTTYTQNVTIIAYKRGKQYASTSIMLVRA